GFIPWDDDMDVWMPREDYDKLLAMDVRLESPYFLQTTLNDVDYYSSFARLRNSNTTGILVSKKNKCNNGIYIDIYPLDGLNSNKLQQFLRSKYIRMLNVAAHAYTFNINPSVITRAIHGILHLPFIPYDYKKVYKEVNRLASKIKWDETENIGMVVFAPYAHNHNMFDKADFTDTIWMDFENTAVPVPKGFNNILKTIYGDYMSFPPLEKRGTWHAFTFDPDVAYYNYKN
ncbi:MAG: LicD family protein, partial [Clostridia bacterium]|nr:LicD family protein [Clostridia bacterium]